MVACFQFCLSPVQNILNKRADVERETPADRDEQDIVPEDEGDAETSAETAPAI